MESSSGVETGRDAGRRSLPRRGPVHYLASLTPGRYVLWCYLIWYLVVLVRYFDPHVRIWLTSLGLSLIIGTALLINTTVSGTRRVRLEGWPVFRLYLTPFCVSSFAALVKDHEFILIFSPRLVELAVALGLCGALAAAVAAARGWERAGARNQTVR